MLSESKFHELHRRQQESGLTVKDFCSNEGIPESTFYYWQKKLRNGKGPKDFIPLVINSSHPLSRTSHRTSSANDCGTIADDYLLELVYSNGTKLRIKKDIDLTHLRALISLYD